MGDGSGLAPGLGRGPELPAAYVPRPRVDALLDALTQRRLALLVAPPGAGKTIAAAGWAAAHRTREVRWLRSDDPAGVLARSRPDAVFVLDDAHRLSPEAGHRLADVLDSQADAADAGARVPRVLLLARQEPRWIPMALRWREQVAALGYADLRFHPTEARDLVRALRPEIEEHRLEACLHRSAGWAAGLVLTAQFPPPAEPPPTEDAPETAVPTAAMMSGPLLDYLTSEVLLHLSPPLRHALTAVCREPYVEGEQAIVLAGRPDAGEVLAGTAAEGFLLEPTHAPRDAPPRWRIHPLFVEALHRRTAPDGPDALVVADAHRRAADHYCRVGDTRRALQHAMLTGVLSVQVDALRRHALELVAQGDARAALPALDLIPPPVRKGFAQVLVVDALVLRSLGRYDDAKQAADAALDMAERRGRPGAAAAHPRDLDADLAILEVWQARCGWRDAPAARARAAGALGCSSPRRRSAASTGHRHDTHGVSALRSAWLMLDLATLELGGDELDGAATHLAGAAAYTRAADLPRLAACALSLRAILELVEGSYQTAGRTAERCLEIADAATRGGLDGDDPATAAHLVRGLSRFHALELDGAAEDLAAADANPPVAFSPLYRAYHRILAANLLTASGDAPAARQLHAEDDALVGLPRSAVRHLSLSRIRAAGWMSDGPAIEAEAGILRSVGYECEASFAHGLAVGLSGAMVEAVALFDRVLADDVPSPSGERAATAARPATAASAAPAAPAAETLAAIAVARVALLLRLGTQDAINRARHLLPDALTRLEAQRLLSLTAIGQMISPRFIDHLELEASRVGAHRFAATAAAALRRHPRISLAITPAAATPIAREAAAAIGLTPRELDVLDALSVGSSNASIASALYVSENTIKTHLAALYRKLEVDGRTDAIATARRLGLL